MGKKRIIKGSNTEVSKKHKKSYVFVREAIEGESSTYQLSYIDKFKRLFQYMDVRSGKLSKRIEAKERKTQDISSGLQIACNKFMEGVYKKVKPKNNPDGNKVVTVQLDHKFNDVLGVILSNTDLNIETHVKPINKNYLKYTSEIPIQMEIRRKSTNDI